MTKSTEMAGKSEFSKIQKKWARKSRIDPIYALLVVEEDLAKLGIVRNFKWDDYLYSKLPMSRLLPFTTEKNAEKINAILVKSWETQGSSRPGGECLVTNKCMMINGLLLYYFKGLNMADNMIRVVGSLRRSHAFVHSFLKIGYHVIDNTFVKKHMMGWIWKDLEQYEYFLTSMYNDGDPADPMYYVNPLSSGLGN